MCRPMIKGREICRGTKINMDELSTFDRRVKALAAKKPAAGEMLITPLMPEEKSSRKLSANFYLANQQGFKNPRIRIEVEEFFGTKNEDGHLNATLILILEDLGRKTQNMLKLVGLLGGKSHRVDRSQCYLADLGFDPELNLTTGPLVFQLEHISMALDAIRNGEIHEPQLRDWKNEYSFRHIIDISD